jgi:hypothetical protein
MSLGPIDFPLFLRSAHGSALSRVDAFIRPTVRRLFIAPAAVVVVIAIGMFAPVIIPALKLSNTFSAYAETILRMRNLQMTMAAAGLP